ncbi:MAG: sulfotransferase, partial [bacterium]
MIIKLDNKDAKLPDFLIVGAAKSGTSSLYHYLRQHPQIFMPNHKEPCFFTFAGKRPTDLQSNVGLKVINDFDQYVSLFEFSSRSQKLGEASTCYLYHYDKTIRTIKKYHRRWQDLKIIIALRNPILRAYSHYLNHVRDGLETSSFRDLVKRHQVGKNLKASP